VGQQNQQSQSGSDLRFQPFDIEQENINIDGMLNVVHNNQQLPVSIQTRSTFPII
jgi:hypothetical protein